MITEYINAYERYANNIRDWAKMSKSDLCFAYIKNRDEKNDKAECYLAGLVAKCLKKVEIEFNSQSYPVITEDEFYNLMIESILYVIDKKIWLDESSRLFNNPNAPEIAINTNYKSNKVNLFIFKQRDKRKLNSGILSLDYLEENSSDGYFIPSTDKDIEINIYVKELVRDYFHKQEYLSAFILDAIINQNVFTYKKEGIIFNSGKLKTAVKNIDESYCNTFSKSYNLNLKEVLKSLKYSQSASNSRIDSAMKKLLHNLRLDKELLSVLCNVN